LGRYGEEILCDNWDMRVVGKDGSCMVYDEELIIPEGAG
jgi:hypothetical protein